MARNQIDQTFDGAHLLKDAGAITSSAAAQVGGSARQLDLGAARMDGRVIVDVTALDVANGDEIYTLEFQLSNTSGFGSGVVVSAALRLGDSSTTGGSADSTTGRQELGVTNEVNGVTYRYARMFTRCAGTSPSINYTAFLAKSA